MRRVLWLLAGVVLLTAGAWLLFGGQSPDEAPGPDDLAVQTTVERAPSLQGRVGDEDGEPPELGPIQGDPDTPDNSVAFTQVHASGVAKLRHEPARVLFEGVVQGHDHLVKDARITLYGVGEAIEMRSDGRGAYRYEVLAGRYDVAVAGRHSTTLIRDLLITGSSAREKVLHLPGWPSSYCLVLRKAGKRVPGIAVIAHRVGPVAPGLVGTEVTDKHGVACFKNQLPGRYTMTAALPDGTRIVVPPFEVHGQLGTQTDVYLPSTVTLRGKVVRAHDGRGIGGATLVLATANKKGHAYLETYFTADASGSFTVQVPRGRAVTLAARAEGFAPFISTPHQGTVLDALGDLESEGDAFVEIRMHAGARLEGRIVNQAEHPLGGVRLRLHRLGAPGTQHYDVESDATGRIVGDGLPGGTYEVEVLTPGLAVHDPAGAELELADEAATQSWTLMVSAKRVLRGHVVDARGQGVPGARVYVVPEHYTPHPGDFSEELPELEEGFTNDKGAFAIAVPGKCQGLVLRASRDAFHADPVWVLPPDPDGHALDPRKPLPQRTLHLIREEARAVRVIDGDSEDGVDFAYVVLTPLEPRFGRKPLRLTTRPTGHPWPHVLFPGTWRVEITSEERFLPFESRTIEITEAPSPLEFELDPGLAFEGVVLDAAGRPIAGARVSLRHGRERHSGWHRPFQTEDDGRFRVTDAGGAEPYAIVAEARGYAATRVEVRATNQHDIRLEVRAEEED